MNARRILETIIIFCAVALGAEARTWIVAEDGSGDFVTIQEAIDAASNGDVVLVREGTYLRFDMIGKALKVVGAGAGRTIVWHPSPNGQSQVVNLPDDGLAAIAHMTLRTRRCLLYFSPDSGSLAVCGLDLERREDSSGGTAFISTGDLVASRLSLSTPDYLLSYGAQGAWFGGGVASVSDAYFEALRGPQGGELGPGGPGGNGVAAIQGTSLYLSDITGTGGEGGPANVFGLNCEYMWPAEDGGSGLFVDEGSEVFSATRWLRSSAVVTFKGGLGGFGGPLPNCGNPSFPGGAGGHGVHATPGSRVWLSGPHRLVRGEGGQGLPNGSPGEERVGDVVDLPREEWAPVLGISGLGAIGSDLVLDLEGESNREVIAVLSDRFGRDIVPRVGGFPLFAVPGGSVFRIASVGRTESDGTFEISISVPDDFGLVGFPIVIQLLVMPSQPGERAMLSNAVCEVFRDKL